MMMSEKKGLLSLIWTENASIQTKNYVAALSIMASNVFGSLLWKVWPPLPYQIRYKEVSTSVGSSHAASGPYFAHP